MVTNLLYFYISTYSSNDFCHILKLFRIFETPASPSICPKSLYRYSGIRWSRIGKQRERRSRWQLWRHKWRYLFCIFYPMTSNMRYKNHNRNESASITHSHIVRRRNGENIHHLRHILDQIYMTSIWYVQRFKSTLNNDTPTTDTTLRSLCTPNQNEILWQSPIYRLHIARSAKS